MSLQENPLVSQNLSAANNDNLNQTGPLVVLFVFVGLLFGGVLRQINKKTKIPYTPMLLILGMLLGYFRESLGIIGQSTAIISFLDPRMILLIFIPVLIFESAFNCDWHVFRKSMLNIFILAGPGVLWGAILIAAAFKFVLLYPDEELDWYQAMTLGCILSATDPVAVITLLKDLGASVRFNTLIQGESLINNGTSMVFFTLFLDLIKNRSESFLGDLPNFLRISIGGPLLGLVVGFVISYWIKSTLRDSVLSMNITFVGAYLCFYIAQFTSLKVSGIFSIVALGLYMSAVGKRKIHPQSQHVLDSVWTYIQYSCETLIFVLVGFVVGIEMMTGSSTITGWDWIRMIFFWVLLIAARAIMVFSFLTILEGNGYGIDKKEIIVLIYGGLRGALGLCLALIISVDKELPVRFRELTVFYMCGMAVLTIVINGFTCGKVVDYVEMIRSPEIKRKLFKRCVTDILAKTQDKLHEIQQDPDLAYAKWKMVEQLANVKHLGQTQHIIDRIQQPSTYGMRDSLLQVKKNQTLQEIRFRFTRYLKKVYWQLYRKGQVSQEAAKTLSDSCDIVNDKVDEHLHYFEVLSYNFSMSSVEYYMYLKKITFIGPFVSRMLIEKLYFIYEVSVVFVEACAQAEHAFHQRFPLNNEELKTIMEEVRGNKQSAINYVTELQNNYPCVIQAVQTSRASIILLNQKKIHLEDYHQEGFVDGKEFEDLREEIDRGLMNVHFNEFKLDEIKFNEVLTDCPLFANLNNDQLVKIRMKSTQIKFDKGKQIIAEGENIKSVYVIVAGSVTEQYDDFYFIRVIGNILNPYDFTYNQPSKSNIKAKTSAKVMKVECEIIYELMKLCPEFRKKWYKNIFVYSVRHNKSLQFMEENFTQRELRRFVEAAEVKLLKEGDTVTLEFGGYVFDGKVQCEDAIYEREKFISQQKSITSLSESILLKFNSIVGIEFKSHERISVFNEEI